MKHALLLEVYLFLTLLLLVSCTPQDTQTSESTTSEEVPAPPIIEHHTLPIIAVHYSERSNSTWDRDLGLKYDEGLASVLLILDSMKVPYQIVSDDEVIQGILLDENIPRYPLLISINNYNTPTADEVIEFIERGGSVFTNAHSFSNSAGCIELPLEISCSEEWLFTNLARKTQETPLLSHIPMKELVWSASQQNLIVNASENITFMQSARENVSGSMIVMQDVELGRIIYHSNLRPFWGTREGSPNVLNTFFLKNVIEESFSRLDVSLLSIAPWGEYQAAFTTRFDVEASRDVLYEYFPRFVDLLYENEINGNFYILVDQLQGNSSYQGAFFRAKNPTERAMFLDAQDRGMLIASHSTWHLGPDVDFNRRYNLEHSFEILEDVLGERPKHWVSPNFLAQRDYSLELIEEMDILTTGDQKIHFLPHFAVDPETGKKYSFLEIPTSEGYASYPDSPDFLITVLDHHTPASIKQVVDVYYAQGGLINVYSHIKPESYDVLDDLIKEVKSKENVWHVTPDELFEYWSKRDEAKIENIYYEQNYLVFDVITSLPLVLNIGNETLHIDSNQSVSWKINP